jgi:hypothetical protein
MVGGIVVLSDYCKWYRKLQKCDCEEKKGKVVCSHGSGQDRFAIDYLRRKVRLIVVGLLEGTGCVVKVAERPWI